nr:MAK10-like protein [Tanacetum cinerariifolium]
MDGANITMEEYIQFMVDKAYRHGQEFNWETATYAIVYNDALATDHKISSKPAVSPLDNNEIDFRISLDESDDEDYIFIYDKSSFSYKLIFVNDLKTNSGNDNDKVSIELPSDDGSIKPSDSIINDNVDSNSHEFDESFEMNHDILLDGDGVTSVKRHRHDQYSDDVRIMVMVSGRSQLKDDLESSTWRRSQDYKATPSMDSFQELTPKSSSSWHRSLASNPDFYDHVSFYLKCEIYRVAGGKIHNKNPDKSWEIIENIALNDREGWNDAKEFIKPIKAISAPQPTSKTPDRRLLELKD